ncbi:hypothetical protein [Polycladomyces subterraneus]|uniref:YfhD family protein n=1 Tax=Polycladomyces subterraneus TaxID=1016997 RepID=A0ABT8IPB1_9BACL|nr:hypothetical protein [Polycladomyces subterraneus]MDN4594638.1 hypothetical protein [Polycladomyces subterraneus]
MDTKKNDPRFTEMEDAQETDASQFIQMAYEQNNEAADVAAMNKEAEELGD